MIVLNAHQARNPLPVPWRLSIPGGVLYDIHQDLSVLQALQEKLDVRASTLGPAALRRTSFAGSVGDGKIGDDPAAYAGFINPFLSQAQEFLRDGQGNIQSPESASNGYISCS